MIKVEDVTLKVKDITILDSISMEIKPSQIVGLVGENGSGKTMLMKCICGLYSSYTGSIKVQGKEMGKEIDFCPDLRFIIETPGFIPYYSGLKNLKILAKLQKKIQAQDIREAMQKVGLDADMRRSVRKYSLGMRQRLGLAQVFMEDPEIMVLDEPFNALDKQMTGIIRDLLHEQREQGKAILISSHNPLDIELLCDVVYEMEKGRIVK